MKGWEHLTQVTLSHLKTYLDYMDMHRESPEARDPTAPAASLPSHFAFLDVYTHGCGTEPAATCPPDKSGPIVGAGGSTGSNTLCSHPCVAADGCCSDVVSRGLDVISTIDQTML